MNKKFLFVGTGLLVVIIAAAIAWKQPRNRYTPVRSTVDTSGEVAEGGADSDATSTRTTMDSNVYTRDQVAQHADTSSCWTMINGSVYDLTPWVSRHPGGEKAILSICGKDGAAAFEGQHGGQPQPEQVLASYKIGILGQ